MVFRLGAIPVRVHLSFFLTMLFLGASGGDFDPAVLGIWVVVVFVSVLVHELGHALMGRAFGLVPVIELHGMGGTTSWPQGKNLSNARHVMVSLAGPAIGIIVGIIVKMVVASNGEPDGRLAAILVSTVVWVNLYWGIFNLLPMLPLDGGNVMRSTLNGITKGNGDRPARIVSAVVAVLVGLAALKLRLVFVGIFAGIFALRNIQALGEAGNAAHDEPLRRTLEKAVSDINGGYVHAAIDALGPIAVNAKTAQLRAEAMRALAYAYEKSGKWNELLASLTGPLGKMLPDEELAYFENAATTAGETEHAAKIRDLRAQTNASVVGTEFHAGS